MRGGGQCCDHQCRRLPVHGGCARLQSPGPRSGWRPWRTPRPRTGRRPQPQIGGEAAGASPRRRLDPLRSKSPQTSKCSHGPEKDVVAKVQRCLQNCYSFRVQQRRHMCSCSSLLDFRFGLMFSIVDKCYEIQSGLHILDMFLNWMTGGWRDVLSSDLGEGSDEK